MSVICFSNEEIVNVLAATWARGSTGSSDAVRHIEYLATLGNKLAIANNAAYVETYHEGEMEDPIRPADVKRALILQTVTSRNEGLRDLESLRYNLIANNGRDFATVEILDGLVGLYSGALRLQRLGVAA